MREYSYQDALMEVLDNQIKLHNALEKILEDIDNQDTEEFWDGTLLDD